ncbi:MAG: hypothetical protein QNJ33_12330 [Crocosphaera sp.]|nr:hypothetical protein [Crocosphaera sp.]
MEKDLQYQVMLDYSKVNVIRPSDFPFGIPCCGAFPLDEGEGNPKNFVFIVEKDQLNKKQKDLLAKAFANQFISNTDLSYSFNCLIPFDKVDKCIDSDGNELSLTSLQKSWMLANYVFKIEEIEFKFSGGVLHIVILALQQSLSVNLKPNTELNFMILELACRLIKDLVGTKTSLKEHYLSGFSPEYQELAKKQLGL